MPFKKKVAQGLLNILGMERAFNTKNTENAQQLKPFRYSRIHKPRGEAMMTLFRLFLLGTCISLVGCETHVEHHVREKNAQQAQAPKVEQPYLAPQPVATLVTLDTIKIEQEEPLADPVPAKSPEIIPAPEPPSFVRYLNMDSKVYLSKAGELMADLRIDNHNYVSVNHITVHCTEYNMNDSVIREASVTLAKSLQVGEYGYWDQVNFGYVHNDLETVQCKIANAQLS